MAKTRFHVLDAMAAPHGGRILRLRLEEGEAPAIRTIRSATLFATGPEGGRVEADVAGFALFGGKPSADRLARSGRIDVHVTGDESQAIGFGWNVEIA